VTGRHSIRGEATHTSGHRQSGSSAMRHSYQRFHALIRFTCTCHAGAAGALQCLQSDVTKNVLTAARSGEDRSGEEKRETTEEANIRNERGRQG
jgi:hypothetical protein